MNYSQKIFEPHFASLDSQDYVDLNDGVSRILKPEFKILWSANYNLRHINYFTFQKLFQLIDEYLSLPIILETGSSCYGTDSSVLFANLAEESGGQFFTVDINQTTTDNVVQKISQSLDKSIGETSSMCICNDSVQFIRNISNGLKFNIVYLDSYDLNPDCFIEAAWHGLKEFESCLPHLQNLAYILIDDTPCTLEIFKKLMSIDHFQEAKTYKEKYGFLPGKGSLVIQKIKNDKRFEIVMWEYQVLIKYTKI